MNQNENSVQSNAESVRPHVLRQSSGCGRTYFDAEGVRRQETRYLVRIWCDCGWTGMTDVESISDLWKAHQFDGEDAS